MNGNWVPCDVLRTKLTAADKDLAKAVEALEPKEERCSCCSPKKAKEERWSGALRCSALCNKTCIKHISKKHIYILICMYKVLFSFVFFLCSYCKVPYIVHTEVHVFTCVHITSEHHSVSSYAFTMFRSASGCLEEKPPVPTPVVPSECSAETEVGSGTFSAKETHWDKLRRPVRTTVWSLTVRSLTVRGPTAESNLWVLRLDTSLTHSLPKA